MGIKYLYSSEYRLAHKVRSISVSCFDDNDGDGSNSMMKDDEDDDGRCVTPLCLANLHGTLAPLRPGPSYLLGSSPTDQRPAWGPATGRFTSRLLSSRISASYLPPLSSSAEIWPGTSLTPLCMTRPLTPAATRPRALPA